MVVVATVVRACTEAEASARSLVARYNEVLSGPARYGYPGCGTDTSQQSHGLTSP